MGLKNAESLCTLFPQASSWTSHLIISDIINSSQVLDKTSIVRGIVKGTSTTFLDFLLLRLFRGQTSATSAACFTACQEQKKRKSSLFAFIIIVKK